MKIWQMLELMELRKQFRLWTTEKLDFYLTQVALAVKNLPANVGGLKRRGFDHQVGKTPWRRARPPTPVFLPGESYAQRSLAGCSPRGLLWVGHDWSDLARKRINLCCRWIKHLNAKVKSFTVWLKRATRQAINWDHIKWVKFSCPEYTCLSKLWNSKIVQWHKCPLIEKGVNSPKGTLHSSENI